MKSCLIVGAGMAGLTAAAALQRNSCEVTILDKGRGPGGRMATRRIGESRFDHGAQFFTVRDPRFRAAVARWERDGLVSPWFTEGGHSRYRATGGMNSLVKHLAAPFRLRTQTKVTSVEPAWRVTTESGERIETGALLLTPPVPQTLALLPQGLPLPKIDVSFEPCFALMVVLEGRGRVPSPGYVRPESGPIEWIADNTQKGISPGPAAITIHARGDFSRQYLDAPQEEVERLLLHTAQPWLGGEVKASQLHRWLYSKPLPANLPPCVFITQPAALALAGDAFSGGRVEGAFLSGLAAAEALLSK